MDKKDEIYGLDDVKKAMEDEIEREEKMRDLAEKLENIAQVMHDIQPEPKTIQPELKTQLKNIAQVIHDMRPELEKNMKCMTESMTQIKNEIKRRQKINDEIYGK